MDLYERIRDIAKTKGVSVNKMENDLNFARSYISKFRKITPSGEVLKKIAEYLGVSVDLLLGKELDESSTNTIAAHFDGTEFTEEEIEEIKQFAEFLKNKRK